jgi:1-acyl-sn-glycerol-3-phosphate acyltransferase
MIAPVNRPDGQVERREGGRGDRYAVGIPPIPDHRRLFYRAISVPNRLFSRCYHRLRVESPCTIPKTGPAIVACNHVSFLDPVLLQSTTDRVICFMMAREFYKVPVLRSLFWKLGIIPVARNGRDMTATRAALRVLESGGVVGIFPEGGLMAPKAREFRPFHPGVAVLAQKSGGVPVIPAAIHGTHRTGKILSAYLQPQEAVVRFAEAMDLTSYDSPDAGVRQLRATMTHMFRQFSLRPGEYTF